MKNNQLPTMDPYQLLRNSASSISLFSALPLLALCLLASCATPVRPPSKIVDSWQRKIEKNYTVGVLKSVPVGEAIVVQRDFFQRKVLSNYVVASENCVVSIGTPPVGTKVQFPFLKGERHRVSGEAVVKDSLVRLVDHPKFPYPWVGIDATGAVVNWNNATSVSVQPESTRFESDSIFEIDTTRGYVNFEIVYTGKSGGTINLMYREYSKEDLARTAFFQNLSYDASVSVIAFKNIKMEIASATNESISFYVRAD